MSSAPSSTEPGGGAAHPDVLTFRPRRGRVTARQQAALDGLSTAYLLEVAALVRPLDPVELFGRRAPLVLEVGFGMGETTAVMASAAPDVDVIAVDVHTPGVGALLHEVGARGLTNVRVASGDAVVLLRDLLAPHSLAELRAYFPDPWPKNRHRKRRLVSPAFARLAAQRLVPGGRLHLATDWEPYAAQMLEVVAGEASLSNPYGGPAPRPAHRPVTRFERHGLAKGHHVTDVVAVRRVRGPR